MKHKFLKLAILMGLLLSGCSVSGNVTPSDPVNPSGDPTDPSGDPTDPSGDPTDPQGKNIESIEISASPSKLNYQIGDELDLSGLVVKAIYSDGSEEVITDYTVNSVDMSKAGEITVTISYQGKTTTFTININGSVDPVEDNKFPSAALEEFLTSSGVTISVPSPYSAETWTSSREVDESGYAFFYATVSDKGTVGVDSIEDTYLALLNEDNTWTIDDSAYEQYGYCAYKDTVVMYFYTYSGTFSLLVYAGKTTSPYSESEEFPIDELNAYLEIMELTTEIPAPESSYNWTYEAYDDEDFGYTFWAETEDYGTPGVDSVEDAYCATLKENGWVIDSTKYENDGYYAYKGDVELLYFTFDNSFTFYAFANNGEIPEIIDPVPGEEDDNQYVLVTDASSLKEGDVIIIGEASKKAVLAGEGNIEGNSTKYISAESATYSDGVFTNLPDSAVTFTLGKNNDFWTLTYEGSVLGCAEVKKLSWDDGKTDWTISIDNNGATISPDGVNGRLLYNHNNGSARFAVYANTTNTSSSMILPQIYRLEEVISEPVYPESIALSGKEEIAVNSSTTLKVEFTPSNTNQKDVQWSSSNESVAIVNNGVVKGISEGEAIITAKAINASGEEISATFNITVSKAKKATWTLLFYLCGSTLESEYDQESHQYSYLASKDITEILSVSGKPEDFNIVFETGGASRWDLKYGISTKELGRYHVENQQLVKDEAVAKASMGEASTLQSFLEWGMTSYPAENYGLFLWNHGGAMDGCCFDELYSDDSLTNEEVNLALTNAKENMNYTDKFEFIAYDACLMAVQDIVEFNSHHFNYMIASQETEGGYGYDYDAFLPDFYKNYKDIDTVELLTKVADTFLEEERELYEYWSEPFDQTQSVFDLNKASDYLAAFEGLADSLKSSITSKSTWNSFVNSNVNANNVKKYGVDSDGNYLYDIFDVSDVLANIKKNYSSLSSKVDAVSSILTSLVAYEAHGEATTGCGLNLYCPINSDYNRYYKADTNFNNWYSLVSYSGLCK